MYITESGKCQNRTKYNNEYDNNITPIECFKNLNYQK